MKVLQASDTEIKTNNFESKLNYVLHPQIDIKFPSNLEKMEELFSPGTRETVRNNEMSVFTIKRVSLKRGLTVYAVLQTQT